jgi:TonB family protein
VQVNRYFDDDKVLLNALRFLAIEDKQQAEDLYKRAIAARFPATGFSSRLGFFYAAGLVGADSNWSDHCRSELENARDSHVLMGAAIALPNVAMRQTGGGPVYESSVAASEEYRRRAAALDPLSAGAKTMPVEFQMFAEDSTTPSEQSTAGPVQILGNVQAANPVSSPAPSYPPLALQAGVQGTVRLEVSIGADGTVTNIKLVSGPPLLVQAAVSAVQAWRYRPALVNGVPTAVVSTVEVPFILPPR